MVGVEPTSPFRGGLLTESRGLQSPSAFQLVLDSIELPLGRGEVCQSPRASNTEHGGKPIQIPSMFYLTRYGLLNLGEQSNPAA